MLLTPVSKLTQEPRRQTDRRVWLWPNVASLDAPLVAILWEMLFSASLRQQAFSLSTIVLSLTVWLIYVSDRVLDGFGNYGNKESERHAFHLSNRLAFVCLGGVALAAIACLVRLLPSGVVENGIVLLGLVGIYFLFIHAAPQRRRTKVPKEALVGILFAAGTCLAPWSVSTWSVSTWTGSSNSMQFCLAAVLFGALCTLNCSAIELWEWDLRGHAIQGRPNGLADWAGRHIKFLSGAVGAVSLCLFLGGAMHLVFGALTLSALAFVWLATERHRFSPAALRVLADAPLLSPLVLFGLHLLANSGF